MATEVSVSVSVGARHTAAAAFLPTDIDGCVLWLRADLGITEAGSGVSVWADQSGNGNDFAQATDGNRPAYQGTTAALNNQASLDFVAGTKVLARADIAGALDDSTFFFAYNGDSDAAASQCLLSASTGPNILYASNLSNVLGYFDGTAHRNGVADIAGAQILALVLEAGVGGTFRRNGSAVGTTIAYDDTFGMAGAVELGNRSGGANDLLADLAEVIIYNRVLTEDEITQVEAYMLARYGL
jgi:hypothetical protein